MPHYYGFEASPYQHYQQRNAPENKDDASDAYNRGAYTDAEEADKGDADEGDSNIDGETASVDSDGREDYDDVTENEDQQECVREIVIVLGALKDKSAGSNKGKKLQRSVPATP